MDKIITYNLAEDFIGNLVDFTENNFLKQGKDISRVAFIFGGKRPALFLKKEFSKKIKKGFFPPQFFSMDEFIEYILSKKGPFLKVSDLDACFIIYNLLKGIAPGILKGRESFSEFLPWASEILSFIEQLDVEDIKIESLSDIKSRVTIGFDVPEGINMLLGSIIAIRGAYHDVLKKKNAYSRGLMYLSASEYVKETGFPEFDHILFCGFFYLHKTEENITKYLLGKNKAIFFFQGSSKDWPVLDNISKSFSMPLVPKTDKISEYNLSINSAFDMHSQVCLVRETLKKVKNPDKTVIVLPKPDGIVALLSEISSCAKDFNVSMGYPLNRSSLYSLFECIFKAQETKKDNEYYAKDYLAVLSHPLIKSLKLFSNTSITRILVHKIEEVVLGIEKTPLGGGLFVKLPDIKNLGNLYDIVLGTINLMDIEVSRDQLKSAVEQLHDILFVRWETVSNFYDFSSSLEDFLSLLIDKSSLSDYPLNLKMADRIFSIKDELKDASFNKEHFPQEDIFRIFKNKLESAKVSFSGSPLKGLQILGLLETRSLNFDNVIIMDVNESVLPSLKIYEPLIPREVMVSIGLNRLEKEEEIQRYQFRRLISSAKNVYLIYQDSPDKEKSRFIEELAWERQKKSKSKGALNVSQASFKVQVTPKVFEVSKSSDIVNLLKDLEYSASSVNTYLNCPLSFYYQYVLGLKEKEDLLDEPEGADIGTFIHELLEETFLGFIGRKPRIDNKFIEYFSSVLDKKFKDEFSKKMKSDSFLVKEILDFRMKKFLEHEKTRDIKEIICLEETFRARIKLGSQVFKFKAIIDRIDRLPQDDILILDYKTGDTDIMPQPKIEKITALGFSRQALKNTIKSFQLPLYAYIVGADERYKGLNINAALYSIKNPKKDSVLFKKDIQPDDSGSIMQVYIQALENLIAEILNPEIPFKADNENVSRCKYCQFFYMCR